MPGEVALAEGAPIIELNGGEDRRGRRGGLVAFDPFLQTRHTRLIGFAPEVVCVEFGDLGLGEVGCSGDPAGEILIAVLGSGFGVVIGVEAQELEGDSVEAGVVSVDEVAEGFRDVCTGLVGQAGDGDDAGERGVGRATWRLEG